MRRIPDWLYLWVSEALVGEIYSSMRAVAVGFDEKRCLTLRYYLDRKVEESDYEHMDLVFTEISAKTSSNDDIRDTRAEIFFDLKPIKNLDRLNEFVFLRKE